MRKGRTLAATVFAGELELAFEGGVSGTGRALKLPGRLSWRLRRGGLLLRALPQKRSGER